MLTGNSQKQGLAKVRHGAGAVVTSRVLREPTEEQLRSQLGTALTHLALAGLKLLGSKDACMKRN